MESVGQMAKANTSQAGNLAQRDHHGTQCIIRNGKATAFNLFATGPRQERKYDRDMDHAVGTQLNWCVGQGQIYGCMLV